MRDMITTACAGCAEKLGRLYILEELDEEPRLRPCPWCGKLYVSSRYYYSPRQMPRARRQAAGPEPRDRRARWREPFRGDEQAEDW